MVAAEPREHAERDKQAHLLRVITREGVKTGEDVGGSSYVEQVLEHKIRKVMQKPMGFDARQPKQFFYEAWEAMHTAPAQEKEVQQ